MSDPAQSIVFEAFGVTAEVVAEDPARLPEVEAVLPPGRRQGDPERASARFVLRADDEVSVDGELMTPPAAGRGIERLESKIRAHVALHAPDHIFVHAGTVVRDGRAIVLPGASFSGKTSLVAALLRAGAEYGSDEFAVIDREGLVHPYPKPLSVREPGSYDQTDVTPEELGSAAASSPAPVGLIAVTFYVGRGVFAPISRERGAGALALLANAVPARHRPAQVLATVRAAAVTAQVLQGPRNDADEAARALLDRSMPLAA